MRVIRHKDNRYEELKAHFSYYAKELKRTGVTKKLLWEEYRQTHPAGYSLSQFSFHLQQYLINKKPGMKLQHVPDEKLYVDFAGKKLSYIDKISGEIIECIEQELTKLRLHGMQQTWQSPQKTQRTNDLSFSEELEILLQSKKSDRKNRSFERLKKAAKFRYQALLKKFYLSKEVISQLATGEYIKNGKSRWYYL